MDVDRSEEWQAKCAAQEVQLREANNTLENLKWGFKKREKELVGQLHNYQQMAVKLYESNVKLRDNLRVVCEKMCDSLESAEKIDELPDEHEQPTTTVAIADTTDDTATVATITTTPGTIRNPASSNSSSRSKNDVEVAKLQARIVELESALTQHQHQHQHQHHHQHSTVNKPSTPNNPTSPRRIAPASPPSSSFVAVSSSSSSFRGKQSTPFSSPHTLPPAGLSSAELSRKASSASVLVSSSPSTRSNPISPKRAGFKDSRTKSAEKGTAKTPAAMKAAKEAERAAEKDALTAANVDLAQRVHELSDQVAQVPVLQAELRVLQEAKIAAERQLIQYLRESRRGDLGASHAHSPTTRQSVPGWASGARAGAGSASSAVWASLSPSHEEKDGPDGGLRAALSHGEVSFLKDSLLRSLQENGQLEKKLALLQEYVGILRRRIAVMDDFVKNVDSVSEGRSLLPRFTFPEGFVTSTGGVGESGGGGGGGGDFSAQLLAPSYAQPPPQSHPYMPAQLQSQPQSRSQPVAHTHAPSPALSSTLTAIDTADAVSLQHLHGLYNQLTQRTSGQPPSGSRGSRSGGGGSGGGGTLTDTEDAFTRSGGRLAVDTWQSDDSAGPLSVAMSVVVPVALPVPGSAARTARAMTEELDQTTSLLAAHVASLDAISAKMLGRDHGQGQGQGQGQSGSSQSCLFVPEQLLQPMQLFRDAGRTQPTSGVLGQGQGHRSGDSAHVTLSGAAVPTGGVQDDLHTQLLALFAQKQRLEDAVQEAALHTLPVSPSPAHAPYPFSPLSNQPHNPFRSDPPPQPYLQQSQSQSQSQSHIYPPTQSHPPVPSSSSQPSSPSSPASVDAAHLAHLEQALHIARTAVAHSASDMDRAHHEIGLLAHQMDQLRRENHALKRASPR